MGILKEKMSGKWERGEVQEDEEEGQVGGVGEIGKGSFFIFIFWNFSKASHLKRDFFEFLWFGFCILLTCSALKTNAVF